MKIFSPKIIKAHCCFRDRLPLNLLFINFQNHQKALLTCGQKLRTLNTKVSLKS
uniref:Uncharacterized protein n=1 Tax=Rhizophora mucronata TaxID=61149 RepID=A0A2P2N7U8_RHIMU